MAPKGSYVVPEREQQLREELLEKFVSPWHNVKYARHLVECEARRDMDLSELFDSRQMNGVSLRMGEVNIHEIWRARSLMTSDVRVAADGRIKIYLGDKLLVSVARRSEVTIEVDDDLQRRLRENQCLFFTQGRFEFTQDVEGVYLFLDKGREDDEYTILQGSCITQIHTQSGTHEPQDFHESLCGGHIPEGARLTVSFDPMDRMRRHFQVADAKHMAVFNRVKLSVGQPSLVGPCSEMLPGLDLKKKTGLALGYKVEDQLGVLRVSLVGPKTRVSTNSSEFLICCGAVDESFFCLRSVCRGVSQITVGDSQWLVGKAFNHVGRWMQPPFYAPCLQELARKDKQKFAEILSAQPVQALLNVGFRDIERPGLEQLQMTLHGLVSNHLRQGLAIENLLMAQIRSLQALSDQPRAPELQLEVPKAAPRVDKAQQKITAGSHSSSAAPPAPESQSARVGTPLQRSFVSADEDSQIILCIVCEGAGKDFFNDDCPLCDGAGTHADPA